MAGWGTLFRLSIQLLSAEKRLRELTKRLLPVCRLAFTL
jgi:hypothetical protein